MKKHLRGWVILVVLGITEPSPGAQEAPTSRRLETLWADLGTEDVAKAHQAIAALVARAAETVPFIKKRLQPVPRVDTRRLTRLIADLDDARFAVRKTATRELERLGEMAEPALRKALAERPSPEARCRMEQLLKVYKRERLQPLPEHRRVARAVEVLESIGSSAARRLLESLAGGASEAPLTRDARGALKRLGEGAPMR
jgi:hypothetical protein